MKKIYEILILLTAFLTVLVIFFMGAYMVFCGANSILGFESILFFVSLKMALYKSILMVLFGGAMVCFAVSIVIVNLKR